MSDLTKVLDLNLKTLQEHQRIFDELKEVIKNLNERIEKLEASIH